MSNTYYAVCNVNGPISVRLGNEEFAALDEFEAGDVTRWIDDARTDAENDFGIQSDGLNEYEFAEALENIGGEPLRDLEPAINAHAGTTGHHKDGWMLWVISR